MKVLLIYIFFFACLLPTQANAQGYVVSEGRPDLLNEPVNKAKSTTSDRVVIRDPVMVKKPRVRKVVKKKARRAPVRRESIQNFKAVAIDGRRSKPRVEFTLPTLPMRRVDETYQIQAAERILDSK